jgi:hypothetical protein
LAKGATMLSNSQDNRRALDNPFFRRFQNRFQNTAGTGAAITVSDGSSGQRRNRCQVAPRLWRRSAGQSVPRPWFQDGEYRRCNVIQRRRSLSKGAAVLSYSKTTKERGTIPLSSRVQIQLEQARRSLSRRRVWLWVQLRSSNSTTTEESLTFPPSNGFNTVFEATTTGAGITQYRRRISDMGAFVKHSSTTISSDGYVA